MRRLQLLLLVAVCAATSRAADADPSGLWRYRRPDGVAEFLEIYAQRRFTWRDSKGAAAAGDVVVVAPRSLLLRSRVTQRTFVFDLGDGWLRLVAADTDEHVTGDLAAMSPAVAGSVTYYAPGHDPAPLPVRLVQLSDLAGTWRIEPAPGRVETLTLSADGKFAYRGSVDRHADGQARLDHEVLWLESPKVTRRLGAGLQVSATGWSLTLTRLAGDRAEPRDDLAELPPCFSDRVTWRRDLTAVTAEGLRGTFRVTDPSGLEHELELAPDGVARYRRPPAFARAGNWSLEGTRLTLALRPATGFAEVRVLRVQRLPDVLMVWRDAGDPALSASAEATLPPLGEGVARYDVVQP